LIGWTPEQVDRMGVWEFIAATSGYAKAHGGGKAPSGEGMSEERMRDLGIEGL